MKCYLTMLHPAINFVPTVRAADSGRRQLAPRQAKPDRAGASGEPLVVKSTNNNQGKKYV
jgi:hypothetical protein